LILAHHTCTHSVNVIFWDDHVSCGSRHSSWVINI